MPAMSDACAYEQHPFGDSDVAAVTLRNRLLVGSGGMIPSMKASAFCFAMAMMTTMSFAGAFGTRRWTGSGSRQTESFEVAGKEWCVEWDSPGEGSIGILVFNDADELVATVTTSDATGTGYVRSRPGKHYLRISSTKVWKVTIHDAADVKPEGSKAADLWLRITSFSASSPIKKTPLFKISNAPWRIVWAAPSSEKRHFGIEVYDGAGALVKLAVNTVDEQNGTVSLQTAPGTYYLSVFSNTRWDTVIEEKGR